jgi:hypothetical protein
MISLTRDTESDSRPLVMHDEQADSIGRSSHDVAVGRDIARVQTRPSLPSTSAVAMASTHDTVAQIGGHLNAPCSGRFHNSTSPVVPGPEKQAKRWPNGTKPWPSRSPPCLTAGLVTLEQIGDNLVAAAGGEVHFVADPTHDQPIALSRIHCEPGATVDRTIELECKVVQTQFARTLGR